MNDKEVSNLEKLLEQGYKSTGILFSGYELYCRKEECALYVRKDDKVIYQLSP